LARFAAPNGVVWLEALGFFVPVGGISQTINDWLSFKAWQSRKFRLFTSVLLCLPVEL